MDFTLDIMQDGDWPALRGIYLEGIATGHATFETEAPEWSDWDGNHLTWPGRSTGSWLGPP